MPSDPEHSFWVAAYALLRGRAAVVSGQFTQEVSARDYSRWGAPPAYGARVETSLDLRLRLTERDTVADDPRQLRLAVATMLANSMGMRLTSEAPPPPAMITVQPVVSPEGRVTLRPVKTRDEAVAAANSALPAQAEPLLKPETPSDEDPTSARFRMMELD